MPSLCKAVTRYVVNSFPSREDTETLFRNLRYLQKHDYPYSLVINMDESWVSTEDIPSRICIVHPEGTTPFCHLLAEGKHITLIGAINAEGELLPSAYMVPNE